MAEERPRRLAAVWFADIVGYTDLSARDEDLALRVVRELQRISKKHCQARGGRVVKLMGDAVLTVFDSVDGAVRAAVVLRDEFLASDEAKAAEVSIRIGVHVGEVADGPDGDVNGDAVNVASRIERVAEPGQVVISQMAYFTIQQRTSMEVEDLGEHELKGLPGPIRLYNIRLVDELGTEGIRDLLQEAIAPLQLLDLEDMGGMGEIYLARDPGLRRNLAVKVLKSELATDAKARARFQREATVIAGLSHPNVITIHSVGELKDETPYFVMDYIEGGSLADRLEEEGPLSVPETRRILGEVASALQAAHAKGIVHRDIKAANVLWDLESGRALVTDWGIAALDPTIDLAPETRLTETGMFIGSPQYMSPEQLAKDEVGPETDLYSLGLLAFELLTGHGPFPAETPREIMISHLREEPPSLSSLRDEVDPDFDATMARCLAKNPRERPTAESIARRFAPGTDSLLEWPPPGLDTLRGQINPCTLALGIGAILLLQAVIILFATSVPWDGFLTDPGIFEWAPLLASAILAVAGSLCLVVGSWLLLRIGLRTQRGIGLGYGWMTVLEILVDHRRDGGLLIAGDREYAVLSERERTRLRRGRVALSLSILLAALLPLILLPLLLALSTWTGLGWYRVLALSIIPTLLIALGGAVWEGRWSWRLRVPRRAITRRRKRLESLSPLVRPWYQVFEVARGGSLPGRGSQARGWAGPLTSVALAGVLGLGLFLVAMHVFLAVSFPAITGGTMPKFSATKEKVDFIRRVRWLRPPLDPAAGPEEAGQLMRAILEMDAEAFWTTERIPDFTIEGSRLLAGSPLYPPYRLDGDSVIVLALGGLSPEEKAYLAGFAGDPRLPLFERMAELPLYDPTWFGFLGDRQLEWSLSAPRYSPLREVAYHNLARAALAVSEGDFDAAEAMLRQNLSVGLLLADNGTWLIETLIGAVVGRLGVTGLEEVYLARGSHDLASRMQRSWSAPDQGAAATADLALAELQRPEEDRNSFLAIISDSTHVRSVRWDLLRGLPVMQSCASLERILWGPPPQFTRLLEEVRPQLVRYPGEDARFRGIAEDVERTSALSWDEFCEQSGTRCRQGAFLAFLGDMASRLTGNPRLDACTKWVAWASDW